MKRKRGYVTVDFDASEDVRIQDIIDEIDDEDLIDEIKERNLESKLVSITNPEINYKSICDLLGLNYHTPMDQLIISLKEHLIA
jgi:hypothetical protein